MLLISGYTFRIPRYKVDRDYWQVRRRYVTTPAVLHYEYHNREGLAS